MNDSSMRPTQKRERTRVLLLLPPLGLTVAAAALVVVSPFAWGAAEVIEAEDWMPVLLSASTAVLALWVALFSVRHVLRTTRGDFETFGLQLILGVLMFISGSALLLALAFKVGDPDTYIRALDDDGNPPSSPLGYFVTSFLFAAFQVGWVWVGAYLYSHAITNQQPSRISERKPGEVDGVGVLLRQRD